MYKDKGSAARRGTGVWYTSFRWQGARHKLSLQTRNRWVASQFEAMLRTLIQQNETKAMRAVLDTGLSLSKLHEAWEQGGDALTTVLEDALLGDRDLSLLVDDFLRSKAVAGVSSRTLAGARNVLRKAFPEGEMFHPREATGLWFAQWMDGIQLKPNTRRQHFVWMRDYARWLVRREVMRQDFTVGVDAPKGQETPIRALELRQVRELLMACDPLFRNHLVLLYGTGVESSVLLGDNRRRPPVPPLRVGDVNLERREVWLGGMKTPTRGRWVRVLPWAWEAVEGMARDRPPEHRLVRKTSNSTLRRKLREAGERCSPPIEAGTLHDARHTFAAFLIRGGAPAQVVGQQMGHKDGTLVQKLYGRFLADHDERAYWADRAQAEAKRREGAG